MMRPRMRWVPGVATTVAVALLFFCGAARAGTTGQISGTVRDAGTGDPIGLANVSIPEVKRGAVTDPQGNFFILNLPPGKYSVRVNLLGYVAQLRENVEVIPDFVARQDFSLQSTVLQNVPEVVVKAERPLIQKDMTASTKFLSGDDIQHQPLRGYQDAVAQQAGVVKFNVANLTLPGGTATTEALNSSALILRGGRPNEVAYYVDGFSQQDPLTGISTTLINNDAVDEIVVQTGGFNAEYGRVNSGAVNVVTREGGSTYFLNLEGITDNLLLGGIGDTRRRDNNVYAVSAGGPVLPKYKNLTFYLSGERDWDRDRSPSSITSEVTDPSQPGLFGTGILPSNWSRAWTSSGKVAWKPSPLKTLKIGGTYNTQDWQQYLNSYRFDLNHAPRYQDTNWSTYFTWNQSLSNRAYYEVKGNYFLTERYRGDGAYFKDIRQYARPAGDPSYDPTEALFWFGEDNPSGAHVYDDYLHRRSDYVGLAADYANQVTPTLQIKVGGDYQRHTLRFYDNYFPTQLYDANGEPSNIRDVDHYGYDPFGHVLTEGDTFTDTNGNGSYDPGEPFVDKNKNGVYDSPLDVAKHPKAASLYAQGKYERLGMVLNAGLRWDYLTPATDALRSDTRPLDPTNINDTRLQASDLEPSKVYQRLSPRIGVGFPISDQTLVHVNYGKFFQQPNLQDLYVSYAFLEHKIRTGGYYVAFGNPNLKPEETTAYEIGITHTPTDHSRIEVTAYYKDVKDLTEVTNIPSIPNNFSSFRNRDFATVKGVDVSYTLRRVGHVAATASYSLSYADGTGSVSQTQRNIAWTASETPKIATPLAYDQRHKLSMNLDWRNGAGEGPKYHGVAFLENAGVNVLLNAASGTPYTPTEVFNEVTLANVASQPTGPVNSRYGPWTITVDLKADKALRLAGQKFNVYLWVLNVFDRDNVVTVYSSTGTANSTDWLNTTDGQTFLATVPNALDRYRLAEQNPNFHLNPRLIRFGAQWSF